MDTLMANFMTLLAALQNV